MLDDDNEPRQKKPGVKDLTDLSVEELGKYKQDLQAEITRVDQEIEKKNSYMSDVNSFFK
jgi:uncharacterized small protein (DUF1192 family)